MPQNRRSAILPSAMNAALPLPALEDIRAHEAEMIEIRRRIHSNPELAPFARGAQTFSAAVWMRL